MHIDVAGGLCGLLFGLAIVATPVLAADDVDGVVERSMIERYPGQVIAWQRIENWRPYRVPVGPVMGYRAIGDWIEREGRATRTDSERLVPHCVGPLSPVFSNSTESGRERNRRVELVEQRARE